MAWNYSSWCFDLWRDQLNTRSLLLRLCRDTTGQHCSGNLFRLAPRWALRLGPRTSADIFELTLCIIIPSIAPIRLDLTLYVILKYSILEVPGEVISRYYRMHLIYPFQVYKQFRPLHRTHWQRSQLRKIPRLIWITIWEGLLKFAQHRSNDGLITDRVNEFSRHLRLITSSLWTMAVFGNKMWLVQSTFANLATRNALDQHETSRRYQATHPPSV